MSCVSMLGKAPKVFSMQTKPKEVYSDFQVFSFAGFRCGGWWDSLPGNPTTAEKLESCETAVLHSINGRQYGRCLRMLQGILPEQVILCCADLCQLLNIQERQETVGVQTGCDSKGIR